MTTLHVTTLGIYALVLVVWLTRHLMVSRIRRKTPILTPNGPGYQGDNPPLVSVLIPAKDEEDSISDCILSVLNQSYLRLEVIVINDRSEDGTAHVVREIAARDPRVRMIAVQDLPAGWTGKTHALATGVREAKGDWLLFIDSDTRHHHENISVIMEFARRENADMVSLLPRMRNGSFWERVVQPLAGMMLMLKYPLERVNHDHNQATAFANGQYILMRRHVYEAMGGHASVRDKFVEDIHMARVCRSKGYRVRLVIAPQLTSTRMYTSLGQLVRGWSRILYAAYDFSTAHLAAVLVGLTLFSLSAYFVLAATVASWWMGHPSSYVATLFVMCLLHFVLQTTVMTRAYSFTASERRYVVFYGVASAVMFWILGSSLMKCFTHRVEWRGTHYEKIQEAVPVILPLPSAAVPSPAERRLKQSA